MCRPKCCYYQYNDDDGDVDNYDDDYDYDNYYYTRLMASFPGQPA